MNSFLIKIGCVLAILFQVSYGKVEAQGMVDGFNKGKNHADIVLSELSENAPQYYAGTTLVDDLPREQFVLSLFSAYGISDKWDVMVNVPFINAQFQDLQLYSKYNTFSCEGERLKCTWMNGLGVTFPLSNYETERQNSIGQQARSLHGRTLFQVEDKSGFFWNVGAGYSYSMAPVPSNNVASTKLGYFKGRFYGDIWLERQHGIGGKDYRGKGDLAPSSIRELGVSHVKTGGVLYLGLPEISSGAFVGVSQVLSGRNTGKTTAVQVGWLVKL